ncbi:MAG: CsiV family protein [Gammaproteobacteria bacterium]|jgi:hypothetical protein
MKPLLRILVLLTLALATLTATAATQTPKSWQVEMILFRPNNLQAAYDSEQWPANPGTPDTSQAVHLFDKGAGPVPRGFKALPGSSGDLGKVLDDLKKSSNYTVLGHLVWVQPGLGPDDAKPINIDLGADYSSQFPELMQPQWQLDAQGNPIQVPPPAHLRELTGTVKIVLQRYLHLYTDLLMRVPVTEPQQDASGQPVPTQQLAVVRIQEHQRMRSRHLYYVDHPLLGILIEITPTGS